MYIFETIFATTLLQTYLDRIKWSDNTVLEKPDHKEVSNVSESQSLSREAQRVFGQRASADVRTRNR